MDVEKPQYDYIKTINAPYWIQEVKTPKGVVLWTFSMPMEVSFFVSYFVFLVILFLFRQPISYLTSWFSSLALIIYVYVPFRLAKIYVEFEPDGKKTLVYLKDKLRFFKDFGLNDKSIYQGRRIKKAPTRIIYEKTNLNVRRKEI